MPVVMDVGGTPRDRASRTADEAQRRAEEFRHAPEQARDELGDVADTGEKRLEHIKDAAGDAARDVRREAGQSINRGEEAVRRTGQPIDPHPQVERLQHDGDTARFELEASSGARVMVPGKVKVGLEGSYGYEVTAGQMGDPPPRGSLVLQEGGDRDTARSSVGWTGTPRSTA